MCLCSYQIVFFQNCVKLVIYMCVFTVASLLQSQLHSCLELLVVLRTINCIITLLGNAVRDLLVPDGEVLGWWPANVAAWFGPRGPTQTGHPTSSPPVLLYQLWYEATCHKDFPGEVRWCIHIHRYRHTLSYVHTYTPRYFRWEWLSLLNHTHTYNQ